MWKRERKKLACIIILWSLVNPLETIRCSFMTFLWSLNTIRLSQNTFVEALEILLILHFYRDDSIKRTSFFFDQMWRNFLSNDAASELEGIILSTVIGWRHMFNWKRPSLSFTYLIIWSYSMDIMIISNFHFFAL